MLPSLSVVIATFLRGFQNLGIVLCFFFNFFSCIYTFLSEKSRMVKTIKDSQVLQQKVEYHFLHLETKFCPST